MGSILIRKLDTTHTLLSPAVLLILHAYARRTPDIFIRQLKNWSFIPYILDRAFLSKTQRDTHSSDTLAV